MNRRWRMAAILLAVLLAGCGGDDKVTVETTPKNQPGPGDTANNPIAVGLDQPALNVTFPGTQAFFAVSVPPASDYHLWVQPRPESVSNNPQFGVYLNAGYTSLSFWDVSSNPCSGYCGTGQGEYLGMYGQGSSWLVVYPQTTGQAQLTYGVAAFSSGPTGLLSGSGGPTTPPGTSISPGNNFDGTFAAPNDQHYFQVTASKAGVYGLKVTNAGGNYYFLDIYQDNTYAPAQRVGSCTGGNTPPLTASCVINVAAVPVTLYVIAGDGYGYGGSYNLSVIGP
jgi:hypothetical protein